MTDFKNLAQLSSDALLVVAGGCIHYANAAALELLAPPGSTQDLQGVAVQTLWQPNPLEDANAWDGHGRLPPTCVALQAPGSAARGALTLEITAIRCLTLDGPVDYVKARRWHEPTDRLAERVRTALALSPDAAMVVDARTLAFLDANPAACKLMGMPVEAVRTRGPANLRRRDGSGTEDFHALYAQLIEHSPQAQTHEYDLLAEDGRSIPIAATRQALNVDGRWLIFITWRDISAQVSAQALVQQFKDSFDQTPDATNIIDVQTLSYVYVNEPFIQLVGLPRERVLAGGPLSMPRDIVIVDDLAAFLASVVAQHPKALVREKTVILPDGRRATFESHHQAVFSGGRWLVRATRVDITQRKEQQRHLHRVMAAVDAAADAIFIIDPTTMGYVEVNEAASLLFGTPRETLRTLHVPDLMPRLSGSFSADELAGHYQALIRQAPQPMTNETAVRQSSGHWVPVENVRRAVLVGGEWLIVSVMRDISARKEAQLRLELLEAAFNAAPDAILVIDPVTRSYVEVNEAATQLYGLPREQMISHGVAGASRQDDEIRAYLSQVYAKVIAQSPLPDTEVRRLSRINGTEPMIEATRRAMCLDGRWLIVSVNRDITQRVAAQARIERFAAIVNLSADALFVVDRETMHIVDVNDSASRMYGYPREALLGRPVYAVTATYRDAAQRMAAEYDAVIARSPRVSVLEMTPLRADGSTFHAEVQRMAIQSEGRWLVVTTVRDISERKAAQAQLELMHQAINAAPDAIVVIDPLTLEYVDVNEATAQMYGMTREQLVARGARKGLGGKNSDEEMRQFYASIVAQAPNASVEERATHLNGRDVTLEFTRRAVNVDGRWLIVSVNRDISERKAAQARQELLTAAIEAAPDGIAVVDPQTLQYVHVNDAVCRTHAASREQLMSLGVDGMFGGQLAPDAIRALYQTVIDSYPGATSEERAIVALDGSTAYYEAVRRAVHVGGRWLIVSMNRNVTERKAAQERVERFAAVVNLSADAVFVVDRETLRVIDCNEAACHMYRRSREEILALAPNANRPGMDTAALEQLYDETIARSPGIHFMEHDGVRSDGSVFQAETHRLAIRSANRWLILATVRDITERKRAESEIRQRVAELELLREAYDAAVDAILIADPETLGYYDVNQAAVRLLGVSREELLARGVEASYYSTAGEPFDAERFRRGSRYVISRAPQALIEVRTVNPLGLGGRDTVIEFSRRGVNIDGRWVIVTLMRDITAAQRAEEEIRQRVAELTRSNQELEQFAYVTSHDLSEPLRMVASYTQLLSRRYADRFDDDGREFIKYAVDGAQRMKQLIDDLLMYSRAGRSRVPMRHMRLDRALDDALANLANAIERNGATIERAALPELVCEKAGMTQVFQNLVGNAIKFRGEAAPLVRISAAEDENFWTISVADNGIGIAPEYFQRIFIIFQRLHARTKYEGTGIGLSICKKIVERHGGQITVASEPGQGTTFSFTLSKSLTESESS